MGKYSFRLNVSVRHRYGVALLLALLLAAAKFILLDIGPGSSLIASNIGIFILAVLCTLFSGYQIARSRNMRIEIDEANNQIRSFDHQGRLKIRGTLSTSKIVPDYNMKPAIKTDAGLIGEIFCYSEPERIQRLVERASIPPLLRYRFCKPPSDKSFSLFQRQRPLRRLVSIAGPVFILAYLVEDATIRQPLFEQVWSSTAFLIFLGSCVFAALLYIAEKGRLELRNGELILFDGLDREKMRGPLSEAKFVEPCRGESPQKYIVAGSATIPIQPSMADYYQIAALLDTQEISAL